MTFVYLLFFCLQLQDLQKCMQDLDEFYNAYQTSYKEELEKLERYKVSKMFLFFLV